MLRYMLMWFKCLGCDRPKLRKTTDAYHIYYNEFQQDRVLICSELSSIIKIEIG